MATFIKIGGVTFDIDRLILAYEDDGSYAKPGWDSKTGRHIMLVFEGGVRFGLGGEDAELARDHLRRRSLILAPVPADLTALPERFEVPKRNQATSPPAAASEPSQ